MAGVEDMELDDENEPGTERDAPEVAREEDGGEGEQQRPGRR
jgi:hypothetical protein